MHCLHVGQPKDDIKLLQLQRIREEWVGDDAKAQIRVGPLDQRSYGYAVEASEALCREPTGLHLWEVPATPKSGLDECVWIWMGQVRQCAGA